VLALKLTKVFGGALKYGFGSTGAGGISAANAGMILLVEDDDRTSRLERFVLERAGYRVTHAFSGENALEMFPNSTPSLVLLDVMLPQMDDFATCQKIREVRRCQ